MSTDARYEAFRRLGVTTVIHLRQLDPSAARSEGERALPPRAAIGGQPLVDGGIPTAGQVREFLSVVKTSPGRVLVHCGAGVGRTGTMVAAYLVATGRATGRQAMMRSLPVGSG